MNNSQLGSGISSSQIAFNGPKVRGCLFQMFASKESVRGGLPKAFTVIKFL